MISVELISSWNKKHVQHHSNHLDTISLISIILYFFRCSSTHWRVSPLNCFGLWLGQLYCSVCFCYVVTEVKCKVPITFTFTCGSNGSAIELFNSWIYLLAPFDENACQWKWKWIKSDCNPFFLPFIHFITKSIWNWIWTKIISIVKIQ